MKDKIFSWEGKRANRAVAGIVLFVMAIGVIPAQSLTSWGTGIERSMLDYQFERADRETTPARWMEAAREGVSFAVSAWERYAAEIFADGAALAAAREEMVAWTEEELQKRYAAYLAGQFFLAQTAKMRDAARESVRGANLALLYEHDEGGNAKIDGNSGDPVIRYDPESLEQDLLAWREKAGEAGAGIFASLYPELAAYLGENGLGEAAIQEMGQYAEAVRLGLQNEFNRELAREETLFVAKRTLDVYSLRNRSDSEAAGVISRELILETEYIVTQGLAALEERINALSGGTGDLSVGGRKWLDEYRAQFERGLRAWEDAEERFFVRRIEWEQEAGVRYEEGEIAWAEAFNALQVEQQKWAVKAEELFQAGEQLFMNAEAELKEAIRQAKIEYERDAQERREAGNARAGAYLEMYITSGTVVSAAVENIRFWAGGMGKEKYPPAGSEEFDDWLRNELVAEMDALVDEYNKMENEPLIQVWVTVEQKGGGSNQSSASSAANAQNGNSNTPKKVLDWVENPEYAAEAAWRDNVLDAWAELKPAGADSLSVKAALEALFGTVIAGNDRDENKTFVEEMIRRMDSYREIELWSDLFKTYMEKAKEARTSLLNDFNVVIGKDAGGLVDVLNDTFSSEDFFLDEYQVELIRAEAVKNYWAKRQGIAEAVAWYANLATGDRTTAGDLAANWEKARGDYNDALEEYRKAQSALTENGAKILAAQDALNAASNALNEANTKLNRLYAEYGELMAAYVSDDSSFFAYEFSNAYQALIENTKTVRATGTDAMYADYLEHAARYYDEAALDRESALLKEIVTDGTKWSGDRKDFALSLLAAASLEEWHYGTLEREPPVNNAKDSLTIRERLEQERDEKKKAASLEKIKMMQNEEYDGELIAELDSVVAVLGTMIEVLDYTGDISSAVRNDNGERAIENIRQIYAEWGLGMEGYLLPSPRETAQSLFYAEGDVIQNIAGFLGALDKEFAALPGFLFNEAQSWKGAFIEYFAVKMKDAGIQATINEAEIENVITTDLEKIQEAEKTNQVFVEHNLDSARYLCAVIGLGIVFPLVSVDDLRREAAKRIAAELVTLYTDAERQDSVVIKEHLGEFRQENYGYADEDIWEAALDWAAAKIIERENIQSFDGVTSYAREYTLTDYEKEAIDSRVFLEESGLLESEYSFYADVSQLADFVIAAIEAMKTANAKQDDADTSDPESADSEPPDPESADSEPTDPESADSEPPDPESADSEPTDPESADSEPTDPESADSEPTDPESEDSEPTDPESADSEPTDPESADSEPTDPEPEESEQEDSEPAEPDFTEVIEYLSARKDEYGALFVIPARVLAYTLARRMESAADLEKVLAALELDVYENAETIWEKAYREDFDLMDCVLHFAGNDQTASAIAGSVILARLKFFAYTGDETNFAHEMEMAEGESPVSGAVLEAARQFKDTVDKGAQYYGYEISGDLFEWVLKIQGGNVEKAIELADFVMFGNSGDAFILALTGNEGGQKDYFSVALRKAVNSHIETLKEEINNRQNILDLAAARHAVDEEIENLVHNGKEHWRYYISKTITDSNDIFTKYNNGITDEDDKLKPGSIGIPDEPADESSGESANEPVGELAGESANGANGEPAGESNSGIKSVNTITAGFLADAFERLEFEAGKLNAAFAYYDTVKNSSPLAAYNDTVRSYMEERAWDDEDLRPADYQYTELYRNAASDMASHFYTRDHLQREIGKNGAAIILAKQDETERGALLKKKLEEIVTQKGQYAAMLDGMNGAAAAFEEIGRDYEAAYQASKEAFKAMEDSRFEYEKQDAIKQWASTAYLASDDADLPVSGEVQYRSPTAELAYSGERLRNATAALDALSSLYDNGEKERAYEDKEYLELYTKYEASFSRMMTAIKTSAALNKAIAEETVNNQNLYSDYLSSLNELTGGFNLKSNFSEPETEKTSPSEGEVVTEYYYTINHFITVDNGKLAFNFASGNSFGITISDDGDKSLLTEFLTPKEIDKRVDATRNETSKVSDFELAVRELSERLAARYTDSAGFGEMALAREYLLRRIKESSGSDFADSHMYKYEEDPIAVDEDGSIGRLYYGTNRQVYESAERKYASVELEQEQVWNSLSENEKDDIEFWTILTLMGGTVPDEFSKTGAKVYESLWSTVQGYQTSNQTAGIVMYAMGALLLGLPGGQIMAAIYLAGSMLFFYESNLAGEARNRLAYMVSETAQKVNETQSAVFMNFADIDRKLKAYHESCDRLAALIGEAEEGETADWALMQTSLETAGIEEETIRGIQAIWQDLKADKTWESVYSSSAAALEGTASWSRREKENTKRSLEDEWAGDEQARQEAEAAYREVYSRYIEGNADIAELQKAASGAFGKEAAAQKKLLADITGVTMANFQGVTIDGSAFGGEYVTLAQDYIGMISRAYAVRYTAEWTARSAAWEAELADIQQKRQAYRESAQLIQQRGLAEWNEGMKNMLAAYNDWRNRFVGEYERVSGNWDAAYLAGLLEKEEWANRATEAAMDASKAALFAASGAENTARVWDTFTPSGMLAGDAVSQSRGLLMATLNGAGIAGFEAAFGTISGGAATIAPEVRRGLSAAAVLDAGRIQVKAATLAREANEDLSERELKRIAEMVRLAAEEAVKGLQDSIEEANRSFDESMDNTFKLGGQWTRSGNTYRKAVIVSSTLIDAAVTETKTVEAYRYYSYNEELKTDMSSERIEKLDGYSVRALIAAVQNEVDGFAEMLFGTPEQNDDIVNRTKWIDIIKAEQVQTGTRTVTTIDAQGKTVAYEVPVYETRDVSTGKTGRVESAGLFGGHIGYQSVARKDANTDMDIGKYFHEDPYGEMGRLMEYFEYYQAVEGEGVAKMGMAAWDKSLWDDRNSWFKAPTLRSLTDMAVSIALGPAGGGMTALLTHAGLGLIDDAVFGIMDLASGKDALEVGVAFGKKALTAVATAKLNTAFGGLNAGIDGMAAGIDKTISQMGAGFLQGTVTSMATSTINSVTYSADGGWGFDSDGFSKSIVSGLVGSAVQAAQTVTSGLINIGVEGLTGSALKNTSAMSNFLGGLAGQGVNAALGGDFTLNVLNLGFIGDTGNKTLNGFLSSGLLELHLGGEGGTSMNIGTGGVNASIQNLVSVGQGMATYLDVNRRLLATKQDAAKEFASAMRTMYSGTEEQQRMFSDALDGTLLLKKSGEADFQDEQDPEKRALAKTVDNKDGTRTMYIGTAALDDGSRFGLNVVFGHEAYRNGKDDGEAGQRLETDRAVAGHIDTALELMEGYGYGSVGAGFMTEALVYDGARKSGDTAAMRKVLDQYDSSADFWKLNRDGTLSFDGNADLYDENGNVIYKSTNRGIQGSLSEILKISSNDAYDLMKSAGLTWDGETWLNDKNATDGRHSIGMEAKTKGGITYESLYKSVLITDVQTGITGTLEEHNPLNIYNAMVAAGLMEMGWVFLYDQTEERLDVTQVPISYEEYKANNFMYSPGYDMISLNDPVNVKHADDDFFGLRINPTDPSKTHSHTATDYSVPEGTPFKPYAEGTVSKVATTDGGGNTLTLKHMMSYTYKGQEISADYYTDYMHMQSNSSGLPDTPFKVGDIISANSVAGYSGNTGSLTTGPHLHAGLYFTETNPYANWLKMQGNVVLPFYGRGNYVDTQLFKY